MLSVLSSALALLVARVVADDQDPPWRRITLHFSQIGLTLGRTFIAVFPVLELSLLGRTGRGYLYR